MSIITDEEYNQFKNILSGCKNIIDSFHFSELFLNKHPNMRYISNSLIYGKEYDNGAANLSSVKNICILLGNCKSKNEAMKIINELPYTNKMQLFTFNRIANSKQEEYIYQKPNESIQRDMKIKNIYIEDNMITKKCPHCYNPCKADINTKYIICDYQDSQKGFLWNGCGRDWCFVCNKKLCKQWNDNELCNEENRIHNKECCKNFAKIHNENYEEEYCQCNDF